MGEGDCEHNSVDSATLEEMATVSKQHETSILPKRDCSPALAYLARVEAEVLRMPSIAMRDQALRAGVIVNRGAPHRPLLRFL